MPRPTARVQQLRISACCDCGSPVTLGVIGLPHTLAAQIQGGASDARARVHRELALDANQRRPHTTPKYHIQREPKQPCSKPAGNRAGAKKALLTCSVSFGQNGKSKGRHYQRQHLSGVLLTFRQQLAAEFSSRNCAYTAAVPATEFYIVPRTGVFTTYTRLNTGLRLQRGHPTTLALCAL